jgi:hypothetical protein
MKSKHLQLYIFLLPALFLICASIPFSKASAQLIPDASQSPVISIPAVSTPLVTAPASSPSPASPAVSAPSSGSTDNSNDSSNASQVANAIGGLETVTNPTEPIVPTTPVSVQVSTSSNPQATSTEPVNTTTVVVVPEQNSTSTQSNEPYFDYPATSTNSSSATTSTSTAVETVKSTTTPSVYSTISAEAAEAAVNSDESVTRWVNTHFFPDADYNAIGFSRQTTMALSFVGIILIALGTVFALGYIEMVISAIKKNIYISPQS